MKKTIITVFLLILLLAGASASPSKSPVPCRRTANGTGL